MPDVKEDPLPKYVGIIYLTPPPGARLVETYDLIERDLCWHKDIVLTKEFGDFVREVKARFRTL